MKPSVADFPTGEVGRYTPPGSEIVSFWDFRPYRFSFVPKFLLGCPMQEELADCGGIASFRGSFTG